MKREKLGETQLGDRCERHVCYEPQYCGGSVTSPNQVLIKIVKSHTIHHRFHEGLGGD